MDFYKGVTFGYYARNGYYSSPKAKQEVDRIAALGIPWICLISTVMQESYHSTRMFRDFHMTPGDDELEEIIRYIHSRGIKVMFRPMIECWDGTQRYNLILPQGEIFPDRPFHYRDDWFRNYTALTKHYLRIATETGCEAYGLDSELNQLVDHSEHWLAVIDEARKLYRGHLTSSFVDVPQFFDKLTDKNFWFYALDSLGTSMYEPASKTGGGTVAEMTKYLKESVERHRAFFNGYGKGFYFGECGCCATEGASRLPYFWNNGKRYDGEEQAKYMEAVIRAFSTEPWWGGMFWWKWDENNYRAQFVDDPAGNKGFTIDGKPAATVMEKWCAERLAN